MRLIFLSYESFVVLKLSPTENLFMYFIFLLHRIDLKFFVLLFQTHGLAEFIAQVGG